MASQREQDLEQILADIKEACRRAKTSALASRPDSVWNQGERWGMVRMSGWLLKRIAVLEERPEVLRYQEMMTGCNADLHRHLEELKALPRFHRALRHDSTMPGGDAFHAWDDTLRGEVRYLPVDVVDPNTDPRYSEVP